MVTKYDIFEFMYKKGSPLKPREVANEFKKSNKDYNGIYNMLVELKNQELIVKNEYGFQVVRDEKNDLLFQMIKFCLKNDINYNHLIDRNLAVFISKAFLKKSKLLAKLSTNPVTKNENHVTQIIYSLFQFLNLANKLFLFFLAQFLCFFQ